MLKFAVGPQKLSGFSRNGPLARKILHFVPLTDNFIMLDAKLLKLHLACEQQLYGPVTKGDFRETSLRNSKKKILQIRIPGGMPGRHVNRSNKIANWDNLKQEYRS